MGPDLSSTLGGVRPFAMDPAKRSQVADCHCKEYVAFVIAPTRLVRLNDFSIPILRSPSDLNRPAELEIGICRLALPSRVHCVTLSNIVLIAF